MTAYEKLRDSAADVYLERQNIMGELNSRRVDTLDQAFATGFDAATAHWLEQVRVLTEAMERHLYSQQDADLIEALAEWAELTKGSNNELP